MKKLTLLSALSTPFLSASTVLAQDITINPPVQGYKTIGDFVQNILTLAFIIAILVVLFMLIWGAFEWITSGGDKEAVGKARGRIINALIGLAVLAVAYALLVLAGQFLGFPIGPNGVINITIPRPSGTGTAGCLPPRIFNPATGGCS